MKKIVLMAAFAVASIAASAQVYVGGGLGFSSDKAAHPEGVEVKAKNTIKILPEVGYKLDDKMAVGIALGFNHFHADAYAPRSQWRQCHFGFFLFLFFGSFGTAKKKFLLRRRKIFELLRRSFYIECKVTAHSFA